MAVSTNLPSLMVGVLLLLSSSSSFPAASATCHPGDKAALLTAKSALGNPPVLSTWTPTTDCCVSWQKVRCTSAGRVMALDFTQGGEWTFLPPSLGALSELTSLNVIMPGLKGGIPSSYAQLKKMEDLVLCGSLSGPIPDFFSQMTQLRHLDLSRNGLSGQIPASLSRLPSLRDLSLHHNQLTGSVPPGLVKNHGFLDLSWNQLTGQLPASYGADDLTGINLSNNQLSGDALFLFGASKLLTTVDLSQNLLDFDITDVVISNNLIFLLLGHNRIRGAVPRSMVTATGLVQVDLSNNQLCGPIPTGGAMAKFDASCYANNKCLCGAPLGPCRRN